MDLYYMNTEEFLKHFIHDIGIDDALRCQYVIVSETLKSNKTMDNIARYNELYPTSASLSSWFNSRSDDNYKEEFADRYSEELSQNRFLLAVIIQLMLNEKCDIIFINGPQEDSRIPYMAVLAAWVEEEFGIPMYSYRDLRKGKEKYRKVKDLKKIRKKIDKYVGEQRAQRVEMLEWLTRDSERADVVNSLPKREIKRLYYELLDSLEMNGKCMDGFDRDDKPKVKTMRKAIITHYNQEAKRLKRRFRDGNFQ